jgi:hypothetical protein
MDGVVLLCRGAHCVMDGAVLLCRGAHCIMDGVVMLCGGAHAVLWLEQFCCVEERTVHYGWSTFAVWSSAL